MRCYSISEYHGAWIRAIRVCCSGTISRILLALTVMASIVHTPLIHADEPVYIDELRQALEAQQRIIQQQAEAMEQQRLRLEQQQKMIEQQMQEMQKLTEKLEQIEQNQLTVESPAEPAPAQADAPAVPGSDETPAGQPSEKVAQEETPGMEIYGFAQLDLIHDFDRVDPNWEDAFRPSKIPTTPGEFGDDGQTSLSVKQTRLGVAGSMSTGGDRAPLDYKFEFDLFGVGDDEGQTTFRLRHAYGEWGSVLAGQTHSLFMDINVFPNVIDYWGPSGMVFLRNPQIRWTPWRTENSYFAVGLENAGSGIDPGQIREFDPALGDNLRGDDKLPDLTARWRKVGDWGHVQVAGILRRIGFETRDTPGNEPKGHETGWGINLSANYNILERDRLIAQIVYGEGIASYMNDGGTDLAPGGQAGAIQAEALPLTGLVAYYDHFWNETWSSAIGYSFTEVDNTAFQEGSAFKKGQYASVNLLHYPGENMLVGGELLYGKRTDNDGATGDDVRLQISFKYSFSSLR